MKNRLLEELKELDLAMARLRDRRVEVINMLGTLTTLIALEPSVGIRCLGLDLLVARLPPSIPTTKPPQVIAALANSSAVSCGSQTTYGGRLG